jgi:hypothetical protein
MILIILQVANGYSGLWFLPLSGFVYYGLIISSGINVIVPFLVLAGFFLTVTGILLFRFTDKFINSRFRINVFQPLVGKGIVYMGAQAQEAGENTDKTNFVNTNNPSRNQESDQGIVMISAGTIMFANKAFLKITEYQPLDVFGKDFASFIRPDSLLNYTMLSRMTNEEVRNSQGIGLILKSGKSITAHYSITDSDRLYDPDGLNIFHLKQTSGSMKFQTSLESLFFDSIENVDTLHWIWDEKGIIYLNNSCRNLLPFALGKILARPGLMLKSVRKKDRNAIRLSLKEYVQTGKFLEDICCRLENGDEKYYRVSITTQYENESYPKRNHAIAYDITDEKQSLHHAESLVLEAEMANKNKTAFLANMSHEIRSPLNGIIGFSELLADKNITDAERERYLKIIQNNGNALILLLSDLIDISKLESGNLVISRRKFTPAHLIDELKYQFGFSYTGKS